MSDGRPPKDGADGLAVPIPHTEDASQAGVEQRQVFRCPVEPFALRWVFVLGDGGAVSLEDVLPGVSCLLEDCFSGLRATTRTALVAIRAVPPDRQRGVSGKSVSVRVELGGSPNINKKK